MAFHPRHLLHVHPRRVQVTVSQARGDRILLRGVSESNVPFLPHLTPKSPRRVKSSILKSSKVLATYGMLMQSSEGADPRITPLHRALAVWGLTADDIGVLSTHDTGIHANEENESLLKTLDRSPGNAVSIMAQKSLVGRPKGGAAAWQMAGLLQSIEDGVVPDHRNADILHALFQQNSLIFPSKYGISSGVTVGRTALFVYLKSYKAMSEMMTTNTLEALN